MEVLMQHPIWTAGVGLLLLGMLIAAGYWLFFRYLPRETILPLLLTVVWHCAVYYVPRLFPPLFAPHAIALPLDRKIPLWTPMSAVYLLAYVQWAINWILLAKQSRDLRSRTLAGEMLAKLFCMILFVVVPTTMTRPEIAGTGFFDRMTAWIYRLDAPTNLLPSIHCLESWVCLRVALQAKGLPRWYLPLTAVFSLLVFASTLLVRQHVLVDLPAAILVLELGMLLARATHFDRVFAWMEARLRRKEA